MILNIIPKFNSFYHLSIFCQTEGTSLAVFRMSLITIAMFKLGEGGGAVGGGDKTLDNAQRVPNILPPSLHYH